MEVLHPRVPSPQPVPRIHVREAPRSAGKNEEEAGLSSLGGGQVRPEDVVAETTSFGGSSRPASQPSSMQPTPSTDASEPAAPSTAPAKEEPVHTQQPSLQTSPRTRSLYTELRVAPTASTDEIKRAYRKLALKYHPDKHPGNEEKFKRIRTAYGVLSDPEKRRVYDQMGDDGVRLLEEIREHNDAPQSFMKRHPVVKPLYYVAGFVTLGFCCCCMCWCCNCCGGRCTDFATRILGKNIVELYAEAEKEARLREVLEESA
eukprot:m.27932 g.27932  ORF g.27932 m.27932 type:complete len:260 (-) comp4477_c0_seq1:2238-3017(-)